MEARRSRRRPRLPPGPRSAQADGRPVSWALTSHCSAATRRERASPELLGQPQPRREEGRHSRLWRNCDQEEPDHRCQPEPPGPAVEQTDVETGSEETPGPSTGGTWAGSDLYFLMMLATRHPPDRKFSQDSPRGPAAFAGLHADDQSLKEAKDRRRHS